MTQVFISYARATEPQAEMAADRLRAAGFEVWRDDALPAHRAYADVIEERLNAASAVLVVWSAEAVKSQWVRAEADVARQAGKLVQMSVDGALPPLPFNQIHCISMEGWSGADDAAWRKVVSSIAELMEPRDPAIAVPGTTHAMSVEAAPALPDQPSLAVLPFANLGGEEQAYFVDGMTEEVVTGLSRIRSLFVIASSATRKLQAADDLDLPALGRRLGVRYVLEGSVRRAGDRVRIAVKLSETATGAQIWADRFEDTLEDVFALQDKVAISVAGVIEPNIHAAELKRTARRPPESLSAYDLYLRAAKLRASLGKEAVLEAIDLLDRAIAIQPDFAPALAQLAGCHSQVYFNGWTEDRDRRRELSIEMAERAVAAAGDDATVLAQSASALMEFDDQTDRGIVLAERAIEANPGSAFAWFMGGLAKLLDGDGEATVERMERVSRLDPISPLNEVARAHIGVGLMMQHRFADALRVFRTTKHRPVRLRQAVMAAYARCGFMAEARAELEAIEAAISKPAEDLVRGSTRNLEVQDLLIGIIAEVRASRPEV